MQKTEVSDVEQEVEKRRRKEEKELKQKKIEGSWEKARKKSVIQSTCV